MLPMKRTTIFLPEDVHERLRREAFHTHVSMAELIRARLERPAQRRRNRPDPLARVEGIVRDGALSQGIDEALYGD